MPGSLQGADDPLLLLRVDLNEEIRARREMPQRLVLERSKLFAGEHRLCVEADSLRQMRRHIAIVAADHLDADAESVEVADRALRVRLGRIVEDEKAPKGHALFVITAVMLFRRDLPGRQSQNTEAFGPLGLEDLLQFRAPFGIQRALDTVAFQRRADVEHVRERALGDDEMLRWGIVPRHDDGETAAEEVVGDFVDLRESLGRQARARACGHDRGIERVLDAGLERRVEKGEPANLVRSPVTDVKDVAQNDGAFGQRARLVGAQDVHAAEVLDGIQTTNDDATLIHGPGAGGEGHADDRRQQLRRETDRERSREQQRLDHRAVEQQVYRQHEQDDDDHHADEQIAELPHAAREVGLGRARPEPSRDRPELGLAPGL